MAVSGFIIKKSVSLSSVGQNEAWFKGATLTIASVSDNGGNAQINTSTPHELQVGDFVQIDGTTNYNTSGTQVTEVVDDDSFVVAIAFVSSQTGTVFKLDNADYADTPSNLLREVHVQLDTSAAAVIEITLDGGATYTPLNNGLTLLGLATFTFFVQDNALVNFRTPAVTTPDVSIVLTQE